MASAIIIVMCLNMIISFQRTLAASHTVSETRDYLEQTFLTLQSADMGFEQLQHLSTDDLKKLNVADINCKISEMYKCITCYYVFLGAHHQRLVGYFISWPTFKTLSEEISFVDEARLMLMATYSHAPTDCVSPLWLIFMYEVYRQLFIFGKTTAGKGDLLVVHSAIIDILTKFTNMTCESNNKYNGLHVDSEYALQLQQLDTSPDISLFWQYVQQNKDEVIDKNPTLLYEVDGNDSRFTLVALYMNQMAADESIMADLLRDFGEQDTWRPEFLMILDLYSTVIKYDDRLDQWLQQIVQYQTTLVGLLKVIMLRLVCVHVINLNRTLPSFDLILWSTGIIKGWTLFSLNKYNNYMLTWLNEFVEYMDLSEDAHMRYVIDKFKRATVNFITKSKRDAIIADIADRGNEVSAAFKLNISFRKELKVYNDDLRNKRIENLAIANKFNLQNESEILDSLVRRSIRTTATFVLYLKKVLAGIDMKVIRSFIDFTKQTEGWLKKA